MTTPKFYDRAIDTGEHGADGKPIYRMATYFLLQIDANNTVDREVRDTDKDRFPGEYAAYEKTRRPDAEGFPLAAWIGVDAAERQGLADRGIFTVEKLAETDMGRAPKEFREAQERAKTFLQQTSTDGPKLAARIAELEEENAGLKDQIGDMKSAIEDLKAASDVPGLEKQIAELTEQVTGFDAERERLESALSALQLDHDQLGADNEALKKDLASRPAAKK